MRNNIYQDIAQLIGIWEKRPGFYDKGNEYVRQMREELLFVAIAAKQEKGVPDDIH